MNNVMENKPIEENQTESIFKKMCPDCRGTAGNIGCTVCKGTGYLPSLNMPTSEAKEDDEYILEFRKEATKQLNDDKIKDQLDMIKGRINSASRSGKWVITWKYSSVYNQTSRIHTYKATFTLVPTAKNPIHKRDLEFKLAGEIARQAGNTPKWELVKAGEEFLIDENQLSADIEIESDWYDAHFSHIYGRQPQIDIVMSSIVAGIKSDFENRFHCVLYGPPACGKSEITRAFKTMFGDEAVLEYDATSTTQAGAINDLKNRERIPKLLIVEEIEKTDEASLRWLLSVLDHRAEIRKTNFREAFTREVKLMCLATVNDYSLFKKLMYGALQSRFTHHLYCPRPTAEVLRMILRREIAKVNDGNMEWIEPALAYAKDHDITDPRQVTAICLCGRDELLTGEYQKKLQACTSPISRETFESAVEEKESGISPTFKLKRR